MIDGTMSDLHFVRTNFFDLVHYMQAEGIVKIEIALEANILIFLMVSDQQIRGVKRYIRKCRTVLCLFWSFKKYIKFYKDFG